MNWDEIVKGKDLYNSQACVYGWFRDNECLYIGETNNGRQRVISHNIIDKIEPLRPTDEIRFIWCKRTQTLKLESELIALFRPKYNGDGGYHPLINAHPCKLVRCIKCGLWFQQTRWWQKKCPTRWSRIKLPRPKRVELILQTI